MSDPATGGKMQEDECIERTPLALLMLCAWNNVNPRSAPPEWWFHPNDANRAAWERVAKAAVDWLTMGRSEEKP